MFQKYILIAATTLALAGCDQTSSSPSNEPESNQPAAVSSADRESSLADDAAAPAQSLNTIGQWERKEEVNPLNDAKKLRFSRKSEGGSTKLEVICSEEKEIYTFIEIRGLADPELVNGWRARLAGFSNVTEWPVDVRLDSDVAVHQSWLFELKYEYIAPQDHQAFLESLVGRKRLVIKPNTVAALVYDIEGFDAVYEEIRTSCTT